VYVKARPEGYGYSTYLGDEKCDGVGDDQEWINRVEADPQQIYTDDADWAVCRDKSFPLSDNCSAIRHFSR
jgi:hypothetical protein